LPVLDLTLPVRVISLSNLGFELVTLVTSRVDFSSTGEVSDAEIRNPIEMETDVVLRRWMPVKIEGSITSFQPSQVASENSQQKESKNDARRQT
jgi:hypothetical protein